MTEKIKTMADELEAMLSALPRQNDAHDLLNQLMPSHFESACEMAEEMGGNPHDMAINSFFDNLQDGSKWDAIDDLSAVLMNALDILFRDAEPTESKILNDEVQE